MSVITVGTPFNIDLEFTTAPLQRRICAVLLDILVLILYMLLVYRFIIVGLDLGSKMTQLTMTLGISILPFLYFPVTEILMNGQTPGKRLLGIKVMDKQGNEPTISQYLLRWLLGLGNYSVFILPSLIQSSAMVALSLTFYCIIAIGISYFPAFLGAAITTKNQRIADVAAGTVVIDLRKKMNFAETIYEEIGEEHTAAKYPQVLQLTDRDINGIRNLLYKKSKRKDEWEYRAMIVHKICTAINITKKDEEDTEFLKQLLRDYNYLTQRK